MLIRLQMTNLSVGPSSTTLMAFLVRLLHRYHTVLRHITNSFSGFSSYHQHHPEFNVSVLIGTSTNQTHTFQSNTMSTQRQQHTRRIESSGSSSSVSASQHDNNMIIRSNMPFNESIMNSSDDEMSGKLQPTTTTSVADAPSSAAEGKRSGIATSKKVQSTKFKKNPRAPKRFKSAFIIFSAEKHKEIRAAAVAKDPTAQVRQAYVPV